MAASLDSAVGLSGAAGPVPVCLCVHPSPSAHHAEPSRVTGLLRGGENSCCLSPLKDSPELPASHCIWGSSCREPPEAPSHASQLHLCLRPPFIHSFACPLGSDGSPTVCQPLFWAQKSEGCLCSFSLEVGSRHWPNNHTKAYFILGCGMCSERNMGLGLDVVGGGEGPRVV